MMARRMMRKHHVRCRAGEKVEITSKPYLSLSIIVECGKIPRIEFIKQPNELLKNRKSNRRIHRMRFKRKRPHDHEKK